MAIHEVLQDAEAVAVAALPLPRVCPVPHGSPPRPLLPLPRMAEGAFRELNSASALVFRISSLCKPPEGTRNF